jgi:protein-tyrosine phosphatase
MMSAGTSRVAAGRRIALDGALNFRDLGGYAAAGGMTARGKVFRSDALSELTERDVAVLLDLGLNTVVDLRHERELVASPGVFATHASVRYHHNPVVTVDATDLAPHERLAALDFAEFNIAMARQSSSTFAFLFELLAHAEAYPLVFHCAGGRDRTGVAAALVLTAAGVSRDDILADYLLSNDYLVPLMERMSSDYTAQGIDPEPIVANLRLRESYLFALLDMVDQDFGGIDGYLASIGIDQQQLATFRKLFVVAY